MIKNQLFIAAALFVGAAIGYVMKPDRMVGAETGKEVVATSKIDDRGDAASLAALRARVAELERLLAASEVKVGGGQAAETKPVETASDERRGPPSMREMRERMEKMEREEPERYAQMTNRMARWRQRRVERASAKLDFLQSIDTSGMTAEQKKAHEEFQDLITRREELEEKMHNPEMTDEDRQDIFRDMRETEHAMRHAARTERQTLIDQTTKALGFTGDEAEAVSATIGDIFRTTEMGHGFGPPPGGPGGGPRQ